MKKAYQHIKDPKAEKREYRKGIHEEEKTRKQMTKVRNKV